MPAVLCRMIASGIHGGTVFYVVGVPSIAGNAPPTVCRLTDHHSYTPSMLSPQKRLQTRMAGTQFLEAPATKTRPDSPLLF
jgi:hypothetical protein